MSEDIEFLMIPAVISLVIKLVVLILYRKGGGESSIFYTLILIFAGHNLAEVLAFLQHFSGDQMTAVMEWYYLLSFCSLGVMFLYAREVSNIAGPIYQTALIIGMITIVFGVLVFSTDLIIAGSKPLGNIATAVKGPYYWVFQISALLTYGSVFFFLIKGYLNAKHHITAIQCSYTLFAFSPLIIVGASLVILMAFGIHLNAVAILPITSTLFLLITLKSESQHRLTDIRRFVPFSIERKTSSKIMNIFSSYAKDETNYRDSMAEIEKLLVTHKHSKHNGNVSTTAASMEIPRSSLYSIFRRLNIEHNENEK